MYWNKFVHLLPGRIRIKVPGLKRNDYMADGIHTLLLNEAGIVRVESNILTGSLLVYFDEKSTDGFAILLFVEEVRKKFRQSPIPRRARPQAMLTGRALKVFFISAALLALAGKRRIFGPSLLSGSQALNKAATVTGLIVAYPLFLWGLRHPKLTRRKSYDLTLNGLAFAFLILQENIAGLLLALFVNQSKLIMALDLAKTREIVARVGRLPERVWVSRNGTETSLPLIEVAQGDRIIARSGETIPVDGEVVGGRAEVDESQISGKTEALHKEAGAKVLAGSELLEGEIEIVVEQTGHHTRLSQLIRSSVHRRDQEAAIYHERMDRLVYLSAILSGGAFLVTGSSSRGLAILLAGAPDAAGLAVPTANGVAVGEALQRGIYVKEGKHLWEAGQVNAVVLDKMAALAPEEIAVQEIVPTDKAYTPESVIRTAAIGEGAAEGAIVRAIREKAYEMRIGPLPTPEEFEDIPGLGVRAKLKERTIIIGNQDFMLQEKVKTQRLEGKIARFRQLGLTPLFIAVNNKLCGLLGLRETLKPEAGGAIGQLRALGIEKIVLLSGDNPESAEIMARKLGIPEFHAGLTPRQKADVLHSLNEQGYKTAMVGDGLDDALAMAKARVGISLGKKGADSAAKVAGIVIPVQDLQMLVETLALAQKTREVIKQNMNLSLGLNALGISLAVGGLLSPGGAAFLSHVGTIGVIMNTNLQRWSPELKLPGRSLSAREPE